MRGRANVEFLAGLERTKPDILKNDMLRPVTYAPHRLPVVRRS